MFELSGVEVNITGNKQISKWMGRECNQATKYTGMDTEFEQKRQKIENRFELARVHVNESRLYCFQMNGYQEKPTFSPIQFQFRF